MSTKKKAIIEKREPLESVVPSLREDLFKQRKKARDFVVSLRIALNLDREQLWIESGHKSFTEQFGAICSEIINHSLFVLRHKPKIRILELGMGYGQHVPEYIKMLFENNPNYQIEYNDLSLTRKYSDLNDAILSLEQKGILKRYVGAFEIFPTKKIRNMDLIITRLGPATHSEYIYGVIFKIAKLLSVDGKAFIVTKDPDIILKYTTKLPNKVFEVKTRCIKQTEIFPNYTVIISRLK